MDEWGTVAALVVSTIAMVIAALTQIRVEQSLRTGFEVLFDEDPVARPMDDTGRTYMMGTVRFRLRGPGVRYDVVPTVWGLGDSVWLFRPGYLGTLVDGEEPIFPEPSDRRPAVRAVMRAGDDPVGFDYAVDVTGWDSSTAWAGIVWTVPGPVRAFRRGGLRMRLRGKKRGRPQVWCGPLKRWVPMPVRVDRGDKATPMTGSYYDRHRA